MGDQASGPNEEMAAVTAASESASSSERAQRLRRAKEGNCLDRQLVLSSDYGRNEAVKVLVESIVLFPGILLWLLALTPGEEGTCSASLGDVYSDHKVRNDLMLIGFGLLALWTMFSAAATGSAYYATPFSEEEQKRHDTQVAEYKGNNPGGLFRLSRNFHAAGTMAQIYAGHEGGVILVAGPSPLLLFLEGIAATIQNRQLFYTEIRTYYEEQCAAHGYDVNSQSTITKCLMKTAAIMALPLAALGVLALLAGAGFETYKFIEAGDIGEKLKHAFTAALPELLLKHKVPLVALVALIITSVALAKNANKPGMVGALGTGINNARKRLKGSMAYARRNPAKAWANFESVFVPTLNAGIVIYGLVNGLKELAMLLGAAKGSWESLVAEVVGGMLAFAAMQYIISQELGFNTHKYRVGRQDALAATVDGDNVALMESGRDTKQNDAVANLVLNNDNSRRYFSSRSFKRNAKIAFTTAYGLSGALGFAKSVGIMGCLLTAFTEGGKALLPAYVYKIASFVMFALGAYVGASVGYKKSSSFLTAPMFNMRNNGGRRSDPGNGVGSGQVTSTGVGTGLSEGGNTNTGSPVGLGQVTSTGVGTGSSEGGNTNTARNDHDGGPVVITPAAAAVGPNAV